MAAGRLAGQVAWIGGGASGMGEAVCELFAAEGASVAVVDVQSDRARQLADRIASAGGKAVAIPCDVSREDQVKQSIDATSSAFGPVQTVVNCAGIVHVKLLHEYTEQEWDELMGVNVKSIFFSIKHALAYLRQHRRSYMVNIGSIGSFIGQAYTPAYSTSKGAVLQLSRSIALDYAAIGLRCNCICPGITDTPMLRYHLSTTPDPEATLRERLRRVPMGVPMLPRDIARAALYLCCEDSSGVTGTSLVVDGGYLATAEWQTSGETAFADEF
jgi:NAD(P)-dependent dehydrogenase (short-subunit alcohol dehydrogenase family)